MAVDKPNDPEQEDRETRIRKLKHQAEDLTGGSIISVVSEDYSPEVEEQFWSRSLPLPYDRDRLPQSGSGEQFPIM